MSKNWAAAHIEALARDETVSFRPVGKSMTGKVNSGQLVEVGPVVGELHEGDIVLAKVKGNVYLHLIRQISKSNTYLIANNKGHDNGWVERDAVFGRLLSVKD